MCVSEVTLPWGMVGPSQSAQQYTAGRCGPVTLTFYVPPLEGYVPPAEGYVSPLEGYVPPLRCAVRQVTGHYYTSTQCTGVNTCQLSSASYLSIKLSSCVPTPYKAQIVYPCTDALESTPGTIRASLVAHQPDHINMITAIQSQLCFAAEQDNTHQHTHVTSTYSYHDALCKCRKGSQSRGCYVQGPSG